MKAKAARRLARQEAVHALVLLGEPVEDADPASLVLREISHAAGAVDWLRERVRDIDPGELANGERPVWLLLYDSERERLVRWSDVAHRMGIEIRRVQLAEELGGLMAGAFRGLLAELSLTPAQADIAAAAVPRHLSVLSGAVMGERTA